MTIPNRTDLAPKTPGQQTALASLDLSNRVRGWLNGHVPVGAATLVNVFQGLGVALSRLPLGTTRGTESVTSSTRYNQPLYPSNATGTSWPDGQGVIVVRDTLQRSRRQSYRGMIGTGSFSSLYCRVEGGIRGYPPLLLPSIPLILNTFLPIFFFVVTTTSLVHGYAV